MFSSNDLISFVFANENDVYYRSDLLKLNLNQHLWHLLHRRFDSVFFLRAEGDCLQPWSFGDSKGGACTKFKDNLIFGKAEKQLCNWMRDQLRNRAGHTTAIVCSLRDFCQVLSDKRWREPLQGIADDRSRTGIFVLTASPVAEDSVELLLNSPVFEYLRETAITELRGGELRELYSWIKRRKENSCFFFNEFKFHNR